jgi:hypothetical protein
VRRAGAPMSFGRRRRRANAAPPQERQHSAAAGGTRDRVRPAEALVLRRLRRTIWGAPIGQISKPRTWQPAAGATAVVFVGGMRPFARPAQRRARLSPDDVVRVKFRRIDIAAVVVGFRRMRQSRPFRKMVGVM